MEYSEYLRTAHWQNVKKLALHRHSKCQLCGSQENLHVHHNTYRPFEEEENDVVVICRKCHKKFHDVFMDNIIKPPGDFWPVVRLDSGEVIQHKEQLVW